jgi:hypothetical protein
MKKSPQQWADTIEQQQNGSLTIKEFCQQESISPSGFYKQKKLMVNNSRFVLVKSLPTIQKPILEPINDSSSRISLTTDAGQLSLPASTFVNFLVQLVLGLS